MKDVDFITSCVMRGTRMSVLKLACPKCSGPLKISIHRGARLISAQAKCKNCDFIVRFDGSPPELPWVGELGSDFETTP